MVGDHGELPLVSVVLPTRNRVDLLMDAVASVLRQDYSALELIVVDDASTDSTARRLDALASDDRRVRIIRLSEPAGAAAARNRGITAARGGYVAFQDDDCLWHESKLSRMIDALEDAGAAVGLAYSRMISLELTGAERRLGGWYGGRKERGPWSLGTPAVIVETEVLRSVGGFDESLPRLQDLDLWVRVLARTDWVFVPDPLVRTRRMTSGISTSEDSLLRAAEHLTQKYRGGLVPREDRAALHHVLGHTLMVHGFPDRARGHFFRAVRISPGRLSSLLASIASLLGRPAYLRAVRLRESLDALGGNLTEHGGR